MGLSRKQFLEVTLDSGLTVGVELETFRGLSADVLRFQAQLGAAEDSLSGDPERAQAAREALAESVAAQILDVVDLEDGDALIFDDYEDGPTWGELPPADRAEIVLTYPAIFLYPLLGPLAGGASVEEVKKSRRPRRGKPTG